MKKLPNNKILWIRVCAALFAALTVVLCFFLPFTTLKATPKAKGAFDEYLHRAHVSEAIDDDEWYEYQALLTPNEDGEVEATVSVADLLFHAGEVAVVLVRLNQQQALPNGRVSWNFFELNAHSLQIAYYFASFLYTTENTFVGGETQLDEVAGLTALKYTNDDLIKTFTFILTLAFSLGFVALYALAVVKACILLVDTLVHLKTPENAFQKIKKRTMGLLFPWVFAAMLAAVTANGGLAVGSILTIVVAALTCGANVAASYLQQNSPAARNYLFITHVATLLSLVGLLLAFSCYTSAGICSWFMNPASDQIIHESILSQPLVGVEDIRYLYGLYTYVGMMLNVAGKPFSLLLLASLTYVTVNGTLLAQRRPSGKRNPFLQAALCLFVVLLPFLLTKALVPVPLPDGTTTATVLSWVGALLFLVAQIARVWIIKKFAPVSEEEKAALFSLPAWEKTEEIVAKEEEETLPVVTALKAAEEKID